jgi:molecular chaperone DnaJ
MRRGDDIRTVVDITLGEAAAGAEREVEVESLVSCGECGGSGAKKGTRPSKCGMCGGRGEVMASHGFLTISRTCPKCHGQGVFIEDKCPECRGVGKVGASRKLVVKIPAGIDDGMQLRLSGEGERGDRGGPPGDLYVLVRIKPIEGIQREGEDLHCVASIGFAVAALGGKATVPTLEGGRAVDIPKGSQPGDVVRLAGLGMPRLNGYGRGDQLVHISVEVPRKLTSEQEEMIKALAQTMGDSDKLRSKRGLFNRNR